METVDWSDVVLETIRAFVVVGAWFFLLWSGRTRADLSRRGWNLIVLGFALVSAGSVLDITDNFESLNRYVVVGDTEAEAVLEKIFGYLGGFLLLTIGLMRWIPTITDVERIQQVSLEVTEVNQRLTEAYEQLRAKSDQLESEKQRAEEAVAAKSRFLANMSHEIRTPMHGILGLTALLRETTLTEEQVEYTESIHRSATALIAVIDDILDFSKVEGQLLTVESRAFCLGAILDELSQIVHAMIRRKGLEQIRSVDDDLRDAWFLGDPGRIRQILLNLVGNAIKFTDTGSVHVRASQVGTESNGVVEVRLQVDDTGIGIPEDSRHHIFSAFSQGDESTARRFGGSGLGLAISRGLASLMGGRLDFASEVGRGSSFWLEIPLQRIEAPGAIVEAPKAEALGLPPLRVLLAEDNKVNQLVATRLLESLGAEVVLAQNGQEAVEQYTSRSFDIVLMDLHMPIMDGCEATRRIRTHESGESHTPIIALSASVLREDVQVCQSAGMDDHLCKPVGKEGLEQMLAKWMSKDTIRR